MDVNEKIEFLERLKLCDSLFANEEAKKKLGEIQKSLHRGENFEMMWKELLVKEFTFELASIMLPIEQKYFPKPKCPDNFTKKVMEKINKKGER